MCEGTRTIAIKYLHEKTLYQAYVNEEVILSAAALRISDFLFWLWSQGVTPNKV